MATMPFDSRRSPVLSRRGIVAASQPLAAAAGASILARGGNAADAAVATAAVLNVTEPVSTGIGGDCFALYFEASSRQVTALNGSGRAPAGLTLERLRREGFGDTLPMRHPYTITIPGACAGWCDLIERHGSLAMATLLEPAIRLAEEGAPISFVTAHSWKGNLESHLRQALGGLELTIDGHAPDPGEIFRNPGLARTLRAVAEGGRDAFYQGEIATAIARTVQQAGGCITEADLAAHHSTWETPIRTAYRDHYLYECPPNGQGLAALLALNILEGYDLAALDPLSTERLHLEIEAMRLAFADARRYVADPAFSPAPLAELLSPEYAAARRRLIDPHRATADLRHGVPVQSGGTVYFSVVDGAGNACSFINSNYMGFGSGIVPSGWGFSLQNRGYGFSLDPQHPNALQPGKRPYHTIIPAMATHCDDGSLSASFGVMGGWMQPQGHMQVALALYEDGVDPQAAVDRPRFCIQDGTAGGTVALEEGIPVDVVDRLAAMGHPVVRVAGMARSLFGRGQIIRRDRATGVLWAGSDPRSDGCAIPVA